ncbi:hypothetical protein CHLRE_09g394880v5 [Chlamydomonas reinhardtii]|uniref:Tubulin binding cofactor C domain-containing protein 1 n=1 Tax=Chlamydomonas reinhardtii TaxID=3055 RepID=C6EWZ9_CHLRE|nr:uncharacterized protein CHLRE_09g394880v5 [Chlamydomonas reinhardtii]ACJ03927.1 tubulin binding cofactor C domain-containing protein 1 [Chlamydomonas reinhardtii]PNW78930.1 hypothetical protein CHLRE_09g394880v5 [Chlamydomonas reinhardtii]
MLPRREVWEYGGLPIQALCPQLDNVQTLLSFHGKLFARSKPGPNGQRLVSSADVAAVLELTATQVEVLTEVLAALSFAHAAPSATPSDAASAASAAASAQPPAATLGSEEVVLQELSLFLLAQLFSKEAQRADAVEYWPSADAAGGFGGGFGGGPGGGGGGFAGDSLLSPTRRSSSGRSLLRQQLQGHLRTQVMAVRGFGDYLRRNLRPALEVALEAWPPAAGGATAVSARELDRLAFIIGAGGSGGGVGAGSRAAAAADPEPLSSAVGLSHAGGPGGSYVPLGLDAAAAALRSLWAEDAAAAIESPRLLAFSGLGGSASSPSPKFQRSMGMVAPAGQVDESAIAGVYRGTVVRGESDLPHGDVRVTDCHEAVIYLLAPLQAAFISACSDCTIVVGAVGRMLRVERCDKVTVIAATSRLLVSSCHECVFNVGTPRPPCLIGDNRFLKLGPYNTRYEKQAAHAREVGLRCDLPNRFDSPVVLLGKDRSKGLAGATPSSPRLGSSSSPAAASSSAAAAAAKASYSLQPPDEFLPFVVPFVGSGGALAGGAAPPLASRWNHLAASSARGGASAPLYLFPLPPDYERALQRRLGLTHDMRSKFKQAGLTKDKERELNDAIQGYFKEWLVGSNLLRQIYDLSTLEKEELAAAAAAGASAAAAVGLSPPPAPPPLGLAAEAPGRGAA